MEIGEEKKWILYLGYITYINRLSRAKILERGRGGLLAIFFILLYFIFFLRYGHKHRER
jgi:hypothetical protein